MQVVSSNPLVLSDAGSIVPPGTVPLYYAPNGSGDGTRLSALMASGRSYVLLPGTYVIDVPINVSGMHDIAITCAPGCIFKSTMANTGGGGFTNSVFYGTKTNVGASNNLAADAKIGSRTISVSTITNIAVGSTICFAIQASGNIQQQATVTGISGSGPYTLSIDEEIVSSYFTTANSAYVYSYTPPYNIWIYGNGCKVYGTGDRVVEFAFARYVYVTGIYVDQTLGAVSNPGFLNIQMSYDIACRDVGFSRCRADGGADYLTSPIATCGFAFEGSNRFYLRDSEALGFTGGVGYGIALLDSRQGTVENAAARNCANGYFFGANDASGTEGSREITVVGGCTSGCTIGWAFEKASEVYCYNSSSIGDATTLSQIGAGVIFFHGVDAKARPIGSYNFITNVVGDIYLSGKVDLSTGAGTTTVTDLSGSGTIHISQFKTIGGTYGFYVEAGFTGKIIVGDDVDLTSTGTPLGGTPTAATWTFFQGGSASFSGSGTVGWTQAQVLRFTAAATVNLPAIPNMAYLVDNTGSAGSAVVQPTGGSGITVATLKSAWVKVNSTGSAMLRVTADT